MARANARKPRAVLLDVFETTIRLEPLRDRIVEVGRPGHELELFFARTLRDGMGWTLAGHAPTFREVARAQLAITSGHELAESDIEYVLDGFAELPPQPDAVRALDLLATRDVPVYAFTHGSAAVAESVFDRHGVRDRIVRVLSAEELSAFKPAPRVYHWACEQAGTAPKDTALVAVHSWDTNGAVRAGLLAGLATRAEGGLSPIAARPHVVATDVDQVAAGLLALAGE